jgi:hypothetical protein
MAFVQVSLGRLAPGDSGHVPCEAERSAALALLHPVSFLDGSTGQWEGKSSAPAHQS